MCVVCVASRPFSILRVRLPSRVECDRCCARGVLTVSDEEWSDDEKGDGKEKDDLEELDEQQLGELLAREQRARHMGLSQVGCVSICRLT